MPSMNLSEKMNAFNKRWNIDPAEPPQEAFRKFKVRILDLFKDIDEDVENAIPFCQFFGIRHVVHVNEFSPHEWKSNIIDKLKETGNEVEFYKTLQVILALTFNYGKSVDAYARRIEYALGFSQVNLTIAQSATEGWILYPKGESFLDEKLVNHVISFLNASANEHYVSALNFYQDKKWIKSAESVRRSVEEFLRDKLNNKAGLKPNIDEIGKRLKSASSPAQTRNIASQSLACLDQYFNEETKHNDGDLDEADAEWLIYQAALLMRYIHKVI